jgi:thioredoxin-related protein
MPWLLLVLECCFLCLCGFSAWSQEVKLSKKYHLVHLYREGCAPCAQLDSLLDGWVSAQDSLLYEKRHYAHETVPSGQLPALLLYAPDGSLKWQKSGFRAYEWARQMQTQALEKRMLARYDSASVAMPQEWQEVLKSAKRSGQLLLVWLTHAECYACKRLFVETWLEDSLRLRLQPYFTPYLADISQFSSRPPRALLNYRSLPALFIVNTKERKQAEIAGYLPAPLLTDSLLSTLNNLDAAALFDYEQHYRAALRKAKNNQYRLIWAVIAEKDCASCQEIFEQYVQYAPLRAWSRRHAIAGYFLFRQLPDRYKLRFFNEETPFVLLLSPEGNIIEHFAPCPPPAALYDRLLHH